MTFEKVKKIIVEELGTKPELVKIDASIQEDLGADSLDAVELIMSIEDEFEIEVSDDAAMEIKTVRQLVEYIDAAIK